MLALARLLLARRLPPRVLRRLLPGRPIFCGHIVSDNQQHPVAQYYKFPTIAEFEAMIQFTQDAGYCFVSFNAYMRSQKNGECLLTFDDGFHEVRSIIHPILSKRGIPYSAFICGGPSSYGPCRIRDLDVRGPRFLNLNDVRYLRDEGVYVGFHGNRHELITSDWSDAEIVDLIRPSPEILPLLSSPLAFAYPFRAPQNFPKIDALVRSEGFAYVFGTDMIASSREHLDRIPMDTSLGGRGKANTALEGLRRLALSRTNIRRIFIGI